MTSSQRLNVNTPILKLEDIHRKVEVVHGFLLSHCLDFFGKNETAHAVSSTVQDRPIRTEGFLGLGFFWFEGSVFLWCMSRQR